LRQGPHLQEWVNPARSTGPAILLAFGGESWGLEQLWLFWLAPIVGALIAGFIHRGLTAGDVAEPLIMGRPKRFE